MKLLLNITLPLLLLTSCSLFSGTPSSVLEGQRAVYQGLTIAEENDNEILKRYEEDNKTAVTYHINYVYEQKIMEATALGNEDEVLALQQERDAKLADVYADIEKNTEEMRVKTLQNLKIIKQLTKSVYSYMSTQPLEVDNMDFWIQKMVK